jgi:site-specific recombinase XerD
MKTTGFIKYLQSKDYAIATQGEYVSKVELFLKWVQKEDIQTTKSDVLDYLEYLKNTKNNSNTSRQIDLIAIRHYFDYLFENDFVAKNPAGTLKLRGTQVKKLYHTYTNDDLDQLYDNYYNVYIRNFEVSKYFGAATIEYMKLKRDRHLAALGLLLYQGLHTNELENIRLDDVDLQKAKIKIPSSKQAHARTLPLKASQIGGLINYIQNTRPKLIEMYHETDLLLHFENQNIYDAVTHLKNKMRTIDKNFVNFRQIRASVITNWLKTEGLRKAQYLAGHRTVQSTERYQPNNLESLIEDIAKHHPLNL